MSMMMISSLNTYTQNMKMQMKWEQKRTEGNYSSDGSTSLTKKVQTESESSSIAEITDNHSHQSIMRGIQVKLNAGKQLSSSELEYLKKYDPEAYQHAKSVEMERKAYEQRLKNCKTKEEVQMLKASQMASSLDRVRDINNNPNISSGEKLKLTLQEHQKVSSITDSTKEFTESKEYKQLPTEAEKNKAEKELKEAKEDELKGTDKTEIKNAEETKEKETQANSEEEKSSESDNLTSDEKEIIMQTSTEKTAEQPPTETEIESAKRILFSSEKSCIEAELTPEAQKVKRAKAHASYTQYEIFNTSPGTFDIKR